MISNIYNSDMILFKVGSRKGHKKKTIDKQIQLIIKATKKKNKSNYKKKQLW